MHKLMEFAQKTGLPIIVCHDPPYCSNWNPIKHPLFSHVLKAMIDVVFSTLKQLKNC